MGEKKAPSFRQSPLAVQSVIMKPDGPAPSGDNQLFECFKLTF